MVEGRLGRSFGRVAAEYQRRRPEYPEAAIALLARELELGPDATVVDLAAGTGKLTRRLRARFGDVVAIEPDAEMRAHLPGLTLDGTAEAIPLADASVDAVFVGDAFHWFEAERAFAEIARVLRPRGGLGLLWNNWWEREQPRISAEARSLLDEPFLRFDHATLSNNQWRDALPGSRFEPLQSATLEAVFDYGRSALVELYLTMSSPAALPDDERRDLAERLGTALDDSYRLTVVTELSWTRLRR
jgi:SAM-dependent methyltransferase